MTKAIIAGNTPALIEHFQALCAATDIAVLKTVSLELPPEATARVVGGYRPDVVLIDLDAVTLRNAIELATSLLSGRSSAVLIGYTASPGGDESGALEAGIRQILTPPFDETEFLETIGLCMGRSRHELPVWGFLPAKGGSGATVTALNTAAAMAQVFDKKVLLLEADFHSGILPLLLKFQPASSVMAALDQVDRLDDREWSRMVTHTHGVDILAAWGPRTEGQNSPLNFGRLLSFASRRYDAVLVDLPVVVDRITEAVSYHAKNMFVVSTPEPTCLEVARRRLRQLESNNARPGSSGVILNRVIGHPSEIDQKHYAATLNATVYGVLPNDYLRVQDSMNGDGPVNLESLLGQAYLALAGKILGVSVEIPAPFRPGKAIKKFFSADGPKKPAAPVRAKALRG